MLAILAGALGLIIGSFLNVVIHRLPEEQSIIYPPSSCPHCGHRIQPWENIPVLSYLMLGGKCSSCKAPISFRYPLIEVITAGFTIHALFYLGMGIELLAGLILIWALIALTLIDLETFLLPDAITKPWMVLGILFNTVTYYATGSVLFVFPWDSVFGLLLGYGVLWALAMTYLKLTGREGMGFGDLKLLGMLGAWLGWQAVLFILFIASITGSMIAIGALVLGKGRHYAIPFGPYLALGGWIMLMYPHLVFRFYLYLAQPPQQ